jgi:hypothetical protein
VAGDPERNGNRFERADEYERFEKTTTRGRGLWAVLADRARGGGIDNVPGEAGEAER